LPFECRDVNFGAAGVLKTFGETDMSELADLQERIFKNKKEKGFNVSDIGTELLLITEELGEAVRAFRRENKTELAEEIVDIIIYCLGLLAILDVDASTAIQKKVEENEKRVYQKVSEQGWGVVEDKGD